MAFAHAPSKMPESAGPRHAGSRLRGRWLVVARLVWLLLAGLTIFLFLFNLPIYMQLMQKVCTAPATCLPWQPTPELVAGLQDWHVSLTNYAIFNLVLTIFSCLLWAGIGILLFWRKSNEWIALIFSLQCITQGVIGPNGFLSSLPTHSVWQVLASSVDTLDTALLWLVLALFPNGRFVPRWTKWAAIVYSTIYIIVNYAPVLNDPNSPIGGLFFFLTSGSLLGAQLYRYIRVSSPVERQQTKWIVFSLTIIIAVQFGFAIPLLFLPALDRVGSLYLMLNNTVDVLVLLIAPPAIAIALLRYRLWDADALINRALVYGILTALLVLVYIGLVFSLGTLMSGIVGSSNLALIISTLISASLFQPLRRSIQRTIDRRFYRRKYDAAKTIAAFTARLRNDLDPDQLSLHLLATVQETMQPSHVSLWLCNSPRRTPANEHPQIGD